MTMPNQCQFWDCDETIRWNHFLCFMHYDGYEAGFINQCPSCGQYKDAEYDVCLVCYRQSAVVPWVSTPDAALLEELRGLRRNLARAHGLQDFMVFNNETLGQMAAIRPTTPEALLAVNGVGPAKMERFGADVLRVIRAYSNRSQAPVQTSGTRADRQTYTAPSRPPPSVQIAEPQADDPRQRYRAEYRTSDGHYVRSRAEAMIDDWLYNHRIVHAYERKLPIAEDAFSDFYLPQGTVYIEFWGREGNADYARRMREKQGIYQRNNLRLISLTDAELYSLDDHMPRLLRGFGIRLA